MTFKKHFPFLILISFLFIFYSPSLINFFSADDWFHLRLSQITNFGEFINFFSFFPNEQTSSFYRPLSTQVFFFIFQSLFGLNVMPYHLFVMTIFFASLYLVFRVSIQIFENKKMAFWTLFFYAFSATHFTRLYFLSAFQEILMMFFVLLCLSFHLKGNNWRNTLLSLGTFILALLSKETAVVTPFILLMVDWFKYKKVSKRLVFFLFPLLVYILLRFVIFGLAKTDSYLWDFSHLKTVNTLMWYTLWSFGAPEFLVDYVSSGFQILPRFFQVLPFWSQTILLLILTTISSFIIIFIRNAGKINKIVYFSTALFAISLMPVIFLPWHKFVLELTLPLLGFSSLLAFFYIKEKNRFLALSFILTYLVLNFATYYLTYQTHYSVNRGKIAKNVYDYLNIKYPRLEQNETFKFTNGTAEDGGEWGISKQVAQSVSNSELFKVFYKNHKLEIFYQDLDILTPPDKKIIFLESQQFLKK